MKKLSQNPLSSRLDFINSNIDIYQDKIKEYLIWYFGDEDELLNYYTHAQIDEDLNNPIYNRNKIHYFWEISAREGGQKKVHSGFPRAIIDTLTNIVGLPEIKIADGVASEEVIEEALKNLNLDNILKDKQIPFTLVCGSGVIKINFKDNKPKLYFYNALDIKPFFKDEKLEKIYFYDYYKDAYHSYKLIEERKLENGNLYITYHAYDLKSAAKEDELGETSTKIDPHIIDKNLNDIVIHNYDNLLCVFSRFFENQFYSSGGRSVFTGKTALFDDLDMTFSQASQTVKVSTPVEYYDSEVLEHDRKGNVKVPKIFNRQYVKKTSMPNGDGDINSQGILTTQPDVNISQYAAQVANLISQILSGILSPATMGIEIARNANATAQREREKVSIAMRNSIIKVETNLIKYLLKQVFDIYYIFGLIKSEIKERDITVKFDEFATPTFDEELNVLGNAFSADNMSPEMYVKLLYKDKLSDEEREKEIAYLTMRKNIDMIDFNAIGENSEKDNAK